MLIPAELSGKILFQKGYKPLGIVPIDPWFVPAINFQYSSANLNIRFRGKNVTTYGLLDSQVRGVRTRVDEKSMDIEVDLFHAYLLFEAWYRAEGNWHDRLIKARGYLNASLSK